MLGGGGFGEFDFRGGLAFESHAASETAEDGGYLGRILGVLGGHFLGLVVIQLGSVATESVGRHLNHTDITMITIRLSSGIYS